MDPELEMFGCPIEYVDELCVLGVIFDRRLTWGSHLESVRIRARARLNILRAVTGLGWGADEKTLLMLYESLVLSTMEYGAEFYGTASRSVLAKLDSVHNEGLRIVTGAFRSSPCEALYALTGMSSLSDRRSLKVLTLGMRVASLPSHPLREGLFSGALFPERSFLASFTALAHRFGIHL